MTPPATYGEVVIDAAKLPSYAFSHRSLMWWGTLGVIAIEGTVFALAVVAYFYIWTRVDRWPPAVPSPDLVWGTANLAIMMASALPNQWTKKAAERHDRRRALIGTWICLGFAVAFLVLRIFEYRHLNVRWDTNAYGSAVWMLLSLHTVHLLTDAFDTAVLGVLLYTGPFERRRFVDVSENAMYWYFVIGAWVPIYLVIYVAPRVL